MSVDALRLDFSWGGSNVDLCLGEGWHGPEVGHRWTDGIRSVLRLPAFSAGPWFVLTIQCWPYNVGDLVQTLTVELNGVTLHQYRPPHAIPYAIAVPGDLVRTEGENVFVFHHPQAASPAVTQPGDHDERTLAFAFQALALEALDHPPHFAPRMLPERDGPADLAEAKGVVEAFQSLGQHCALGAVQRHYGAEPFGLLRFAGIFPDRLVKGLQSRFEGIGDVGALSFFTHEGSRELQGRHAVYGLDYHTFKRADETDVAALTVKEARRLDYLARLFFEQLENDEKIFLRLEDFAAPGEALALHRLLCAHQPRARLLILDAAPAHARERVGRVVELRPRLYRGYLANATDPAVGPRPDAQEWLRLLATVLSYERDAES